MGSHITVHGLSKNQQGDSQRLLIAGGFVREEGDIPSTIDAETDFSKGHSVCPPVTPPALMALIHSCVPRAWPCSRGSLTDERLAWQGCSTTCGGRTLTARHLF